MSQISTPPKHADLPPFHVLLMAAGKGTRAGGNTPKQFSLINGAPILSYSIEIFANMPQCQSICIVTDANNIQQVQDQFKSEKIVHVVAGGKERKNSVYNGLNAFSNLNYKDIILIHDAARPCVKRQNIETLLQSLSQHRAASLATPISATLRKSGNDNAATETISRDGLWALQTPQAARYGDLLKAHKNADPQAQYTDDTALLSTANIPVTLIEGAASNIKITYPDDFEMAEKLLAKPKTTLIGQGYDVHAFDIDSKGPLRLCGVDVPHTHKLKGHSDADVGLHAITDAILGAIGAGDIGRHFPPSDDQYKDMDSAIFLEKTMDMLAAKNGQINNLDLTLICEEPKITPHAEAMQKRLGKITGLDTRRINIKATTSEGLGFTGRKEGIAAQAIVTVTMPEDQ